MTYLSKTILYRAKMLLPTVRVIIYVNLCKFAVFPCSSALLDIPRVVPKAGRTNMASKHENYKLEYCTDQTAYFKLKLHGPIHKLWYKEYS